MSRSRIQVLPGARRSPLILVLLLASLVLVGVLGWQSWRLQRSNAVIAEAVLHDYAGLVIDEYERRATTALGYRGYYPLITAIANSESPSAMREALDAGQPDDRPPSLVAGLFIVTDDGTQMDIGAPGPVVAALLEEVRRFVARANAPYYSLFDTSGREQAIFAVRDDTSGRRRPGFIVAGRGVSTSLQAAQASGPLLPASLAGGHLSNDMLFLRVRNPAGDVLYEAHPEFYGSLTVERTLGDDYQGILAGYTIAASLDPASASSLVIGGLPQSRLPLLLFVMLMVVVLLVMAIWLSSREQAVMAMRADFISQVSHELRTPLTQIRMFAETFLLDRLRNESDRIRALQIINGEAQRLTHLVENILQFSTRAKTTKCNLRLQPIAPVIRDVCGTLQATANQTCFVLDLDDTAVGIVDTDALRQILLNLLDNAVKYGPKPQRVTVALAVQGDVLRVSVADEGPGIPAAERDRVWSAFYRLGREQDTAVSGTGIGLAVVRALVEAMHGRCYVADSSRGAEFVVELPIGAERG
jgi:signal transduction histidine kinase